MPFFVGLQWAKDRWKKQKWIWNKNPKKKRFEVQLEHFQCPIANRAIHLFVRYDFLYDSLARIFVIFPFYTCFLFDAHTDTLTGHILYNTYEVIFNLDMWIRHNEDKNTPSTTAAIAAAANIGRNTNHSCSARHNEDRSTSLCDGKQEQKKIIAI